jgi:aspartate aminotransferase
MKSVNETPPEFGHVKPHPPDPILSLVSRFITDRNPEKVNMSVGAYRDEEGKPYPFPVVKKAQKLILDDESINFEYSPIDGDQGFNRAAR